MKEQINLLMTFYDSCLHGKKNVIKLVLLSLLSQGHILIEDIPGLGKTTLAVVVSKSLGLSFGRVQSTNDILPSDITGLSIYDKNIESFKFHPGPIFNNIILVDEINRATPKTQSALLEAMGEKQVTVDGITHKLPDPFFVIATQNPSEHYGINPLPESQLDRFVIKTSIGYPSRQDELNILTNGSLKNNIHNIFPVLNSEQINIMIAHVRSNIYISDKIKNYILNIATETRLSPFIETGLSTRGLLSVADIAKASAFLAARDFVIPEDITDYAQYTITHRLIFKNSPSEKDKKEIVKSTIASVPQPV